MKDRKVKMSTAAMAALALSAIAPSDAFQREAMRGIPIPPSPDPKAKEKRCEALCKGEKPHAHNCPIGLAEFNQSVSTRQVHRHYARVMAKRGAR